MSAFVKTQKKRFTFIILLVFLYFYVGYFSQVVNSHYETVQLQEDIKLSQNDVFIHGELESYGNPGLDANVNCAALRKRDDSESNFIYTGVLTSEKTMGGLGKAVFETWGQMTDNIEFYMGETDYKCDGCQNMSVVHLEGVKDVEYPPLKKVFYTMLHMCKHHVHRYRWFLRADDDGYFKFANLRQLLSSLNDSRPIVLGMPNRGYSYGLFYLKMYGRRYCDGSATIYNQAALKSQCDVLHQCYVNSPTVHDDVELGRCAMEHLGIQCATSTGQLTLFDLFYHTYWNDKTSFSGQLDGVKYVQRAIHMHKIPTAQTMHNLHAYYTRTQNWLHDKCAQASGDGELTTDIRHSNNSNNTNSKSSSKNDHRRKSNKHNNRNSNSNNNNNNSNNNSSNNKH